MMKVSLARSPDRPYVWINTPLHPTTLAAINKRLSFQPVGFERTTAYQTGEWDGWVRLLYQAKNKKSYFFPQGLLAAVRDTLTSLGYDVSYRGQIRPVGASGELPWKGPELRPYQQTIVNQVHKFFDKGEGVIVALGTGGGKTMVALKIIQELGLSTIVTVHTKELIDQWQKAIETNLGDKCAVYGSGKKESGNITVATVQTLEKIKGLNLPQDVVIFDECVAGDALIQTDHGKFTIKDIVEKRLDVKVKTHTGEYKKIKNYYKIPRKQPLIHVVHENGILKCTPEHRIKTTRGWIEAKDLIPGSDMVNTYDTHFGWFGWSKVNEIQM